MEKHDDAKKAMINLLKQDPDNEVYWVQLHLYTMKLNPHTSKQALFKAYELNPSSAHVLNNLISYYYKA